MKLKINHKTLVGTGTYKKCGTGIGIEYPYVPSFFNPDLVDDFTCDNFVTLRQRDNATT